jgi:tRNA(adenine34) deaminase
VLDKTVSNVNEAFMCEAYREAETAFSRGEVPIGAVIVRDGVIIARGSNRVRERSDPTAHAECEAIRQACIVTGDWRLTGTTLFVTLEPCAMCAGAMIESRIPDLVYGAPETRWDRSITHLLLCGGRFNHTVQVVEGVLEDECRALLNRFFHELRTK